LPCLLLVKVLGGVAVTAVQRAETGAPVPAMYPLAVVAEPITVTSTQAGTRDPIATCVLAAITLYVGMPCAARAIRAIVLTQAVSVRAAVMGAGMSPVTAVIGGPAIAASRLGGRRTLADRERRNGSCAA
jgi:hypothetical protein